MRTFLRTTTEEAYAFHKIFRDLLADENVSTAKTLTLIANELQIMSGKELAVSVLSGKDELAAIGKKQFNMFEEAGHIYVLNGFLSRAKPREVLAAFLEMPTVGEIDVRPANRQSPLWFTVPMNQSPAAGKSSTIAALDKSVVLAMMTGHHLGDLNKMVDSWKPGRPMPSATGMVDYERSRKSVQESAKMLLGMDHFDPPVKPEVQNYDAGVQAGPT